MPSRNDVNREPVAEDRRRREDSRDTQSHRLLAFPACAALAPVPQGPLSPAPACRRSRPAGDPLVRTASPDTPRACSPCPLSGATRRRASMSGRSPSLRAATSSLCSARFAASLLLRDIDVRRVNWIWALSCFNAYRSRPLPELRAIRSWRASSLARKSSRGLSSGESDSSTLLDIAAARSRGCAGRRVARRRSRAPRAGRRSPRCRRERAPRRSRLCADGGRRARHPRGPEERREPGAPADPESFGQHTLDELRPRGKLALGDRRGDPFADGDFGNAGGTTPPSLPQCRFTVFYAGLYAIVQPRQGFGLVS